MHRPTRPLTRHPDIRDLSSEGAAVADIASAVSGVSASIAVSPSHSGRNVQVGDTAEEGTAAGILGADILEADTGEDSCRR